MSNDRLSLEIKVRQSRFAPSLICSSQSELHTCGGLRMISLRKEWRLETVALILPVRSHPFRETVELLNHSSYIPVLGSLSSCPHKRWRTINPRAGRLPQFHRPVRPQDIV